MPFENMEVTTLTSICLNGCRKSNVERLLASRTLWCAVGRRDPDKEETKDGAGFEPFWVVVRNLSMT